MINGTHVVIYSTDAEADRAFFRDVLGFHWVDAGHGWLIFALPSTEAAFHPAEGNNQHKLYLTCDDVTTEVVALRSKGVECSEITEERWGLITKIQLPGGGEIGMYQPKHTQTTRQKATPVA